MTVISWYGNLRLGVQLVHDDVKEYKSHKRDLEDMVESLDRQKKKLEQWKRDWLVLEHTPETLFIRYWGIDGYKSITGRMAFIEAVCDEAKMELSSFLKDRKFKLAASAFLNQKRLKFKFLYLKKKYVLGLLDKLGRALNELDEVSKDGLRRQWELRPNVDIDFERVRNVGMGFLLVSLAMRTEAYTEDFCRCCHAACEILSTELYLDIFDASSRQRRKKQSETIVEAAADRHVTLTILTRAAAMTKTEMTWLCFKESTMPNDGSFTTLADTIDYISKNSAECHFIARSGDPNASDLTFRVFRSASADHGPEYDSRISMRDIQMQNQPDRSLLGHVSRFRVAFELAQACLLFLRTRWFSNICSCKIRCGRLDNQSYDFTLHFKSSDHVLSQVAGTGDECWGHAQHTWNGLTKPLRRLALLLIEVTLGTNILNVESDENSAISFVSFVATRSRSQPNSQEVTRCSIHEMLGKVSEAALNNDPFTEAVKYCATTKGPESPETDERTRLYLSDFYSEAVVPLVSYKELLQALTNVFQHQEAVRVFA